MTVKLDRPTRTETVYDQFGSSTFPAYDVGDCIMVVPPGSGRAQRVEIVVDQPGMYYTVQNRWGKQFQTRKDFVYGRVVD